MELNLSQEQKEALVRALNKYPTNPTIMNAVYISPAQQLRNRANEIEQEERDFPLLKEILAKLTY